MNVWTPTEEESLTYAIAWQIANDPAYDAKTRRNMREHCKAMLKEQVARASAAGEKS